MQPRGVADDAGRSVAIGGSRRVPATRSAAASYGAAAPSSCATLPSSARRASASTASSDAPLPATTTAAISPSTNGASLRRTGVARCDELQSQSRAEDRRAQVHQDQHAVGRGDLVDRRGDGDGIRPGRAAGGAGGDADSGRVISAHLEGEVDGSPREGRGVRDDDDSDHVSPRAHPRVRGRAASSMPRPGRGVRRCARRGSSHVPCVRPAVRSRRGRPRRRQEPPPRPPPPTRRRLTAASHASTAGAIASNIVLSPSSALPRATMPSSPARRAAPRPAASRSVTGPALIPNRRKNVPYSGPLAPPTLVTSVMPTDLKRSAMFAACLAVELRGHGAHAARHVRAVVGVADHRVELGELGLVLGDECPEAAEPVGQLIDRDRRSMRAASCRRLFLSCAPAQTGGD